MALVSRGFRCDECRCVILGGLGGLFEFEFVQHSAITGVCCRVGDMRDAVVVALRCRGCVVIVDGRVYSVDEVVVVGVVLAGQLGEGRINFVNETGG